MKLQENEKADELKTSISVTGATAPKKEIKNLILKKDINLLPKNILEQRRFDAQYKKAFIIFLKILAGACLLIVVPYILRISLAFDKNDLMKRIDEISPIEKLEKQVVLSNKQLQSYQDLMDELNKNDSIISVVLTTMEKAIPKTLYLVSLSQDTSEIKAKGDEEASIQKKLIISGIAKDKYAVAEFQKSLKDSNMYKSVFVGSITETDIKNEEKVKVSVINEYGELVEKEIPVTVDFNIEVSFGMECILNDFEK